MFTLRDFYSITVPKPQFSYMYVYSLSFLYYRSSYISSKSHCFFGWSHFLCVCDATVQVKLKINEVSYLFLPLIYLLSVSFIDPAIKPRRVEEKSFHPYHTYTCIFFVHILQIPFYYKVPLPHVLVSSLVHIPRKYYT